ncbi:DNA-binding transcriptional regulator, MarR family [Thermomonospora echinospora]|uniref:DNA-binding transcriptional regulator, MarR family n=1 Tax=Thermomonospora echinospora TaxID=1992 RepID=A0A1H6B2N5_9ACTN|nr:MarR family transcriptional regulator [Thermomonospora echinospora]SEG55111.1 DNA-binding transcriptional regulator, MarR family [Thermomonospora echinospora]
MDRHSALRELAPLLREISRTLLRVGPTRAGIDPLPASEADMLRLIVRSPGVSPGRLAAEMHMKPSNVSAALRHLTDLGLIVRETDPADRRTWRVLPTPRAVENARRIEDARARMLDEVLGELPPDHAEALLRAVPALQALERALRTREGGRAL